MASPTSMSSSALTRTAVKSGCSESHLKWSLWPPKRANLANSRPAFITMVRTNTPLTSAVTAHSGLSTSTPHTRGANAMRGGEKCELVFLPVRLLD